MGTEEIQVPGAGDAPGIRTYVARVGELKFFCVTLDVSEGCWEGFLDTNKKNKL